MQLRQPSLGTSELLAKRNAPKLLPQQEAMEILQCKPLGN